LTAGGRRNKQRGVSTRSPHRRTYPLPVEVGLLAAVLLAWQAARIPFESSFGVAVEHARTWLSVEGALRLDVEDSIIRGVHRAALGGVLGWAYENIHLAAIFAFMIAARLAAPARYPVLRTAFALAHVPAIGMVAAYALAPPHWLPEMPYAVGLQAEGLAGTLGEQLRNSTAATVSMHFGYAAFIAGAAVWLARRRRHALLALAWPGFVFLVIVGTGNHYVLDCVLGLAAVALGAAGAWILHSGPLVAGVRPAPRAEIVRLAAAAALIAYGLTAILAGRFAFDRPSPQAAALVVALGLLCCRWLVPAPASGSGLQWKA
jgi:hypothetical protein